MPPSLDANYSQILESQLKMNRETWRALEQHGVTAGTDLSLDFTYVAPSEPAAEALRERLAVKRVLDLKITPTGFLFWKRWRVTGSTQPMPVSLEVLNEWVTTMVTVGQDAHCAFDGWGTAVPMGGAAPSEGS